MWHGLEVILLVLSVNAAEETDPSTDFDRCSQLLWTMFPLGPEDQYQCWGVWATCGLVTDKVQCRRACSEF